MSDTVLSRCITRRAAAADANDVELMERLDSGCSAVLTDAEYVSYASAARTADDALRQRIIDATPPWIPFYCRVCRAFTGDDRHDHEGDR